MHVLLASVSSATSPAGVCRHAANVARGLIASPLVTKVTMFTGDWQADYFRNAFHLENEKLEIRLCAIKNTSLARNFWYMRELPSAARACGADVVHLAYPMPVLRSNFDAPVVLSLHDMYPFQISRNFGKRAWMNRTALKLCLKNVDAVACVSEETRLALRTFFPTMDRKHIAVVPNSIYLPRSPHNTPLPSMLRGYPFFLCVAQHRPNKNLPFLLRTFCLALDRGVVNRNAKLVLLGRDGPETPKLHEFVMRYGIDGNIVFMSGISDEVLSSLYTRSELVIAPSLLEGFGLPVAEALNSSGRVVCSDIAAFRSIGDGRCVFFDPADESGESLLAAMQKGREMPRVLANASGALEPQAAGALYIALYSGLLQSQGLASSRVIPAEIPEPHSHPPSIYRSTTERQPL